MDEETLNVPALPPLQSLVPYMSKKRFAEIVGVELGVVDGWVDKGYIPSTKIGKHQLVNVARLWQKAMAED
jgi:hypothetical protein